MNRSLIRVAGWVGQAVAAWLVLARQRPLAAEIVALRERLEKLGAENEILRARLKRFDPHARPHYRPWERLQILLHRARYGLSIEATARAFVITGQTVINWLREIESGFARLVQARRPMNALPDLVREVAVFVKREWPRWGTRRIAGILARLGLKASRTTVQRVLRRPPPGRPATGPRGRASPVRARRPNQVWIVDFTRVGQFFRSVVVGCVLDAFSRRVVALRVWDVDPDSADACLLLRKTLCRNDRPTWIVSDRGIQFTAGRFRRFLARRRIRRRYAAVGDANLARIDRFWRTMKSEFATGLLLLRPRSAIERELGAWVRWYNAERPHTSLGLRTPDEIHEGRRVRPRRHIEKGTLEVRFADPERRLPVFRLRRAA